MAAVKTSGLEKRFDSVTAVEELELEVAEGELFGLVGPDGAGKTTTLRILAGLLDPDRGEVTVQDLHLPRQRGRLHTRIGYLAQQFSLYPDLTVDENIAFFAQIHDVSAFDERRRELLSFAALTPFRNRLADDLSGGMRQKLALACTLVHRPELLLLDEPTTGVDPVARREMWTLLSEINQQGVTVLMSTPYLDEAERCGRVALMNRGRVLMAGSPSEVIEEAVTMDVVEVVCDRAREARALLTDLGDVEDIQLFGNRLDILTRHPDVVTETVTQRLTDNGIAVQRLRRKRPSLDNAFIALLT